MSDQPETLHYHPLDQGRDWHRDFSHENGSYFCFVRAQLAGGGR